MRTHRDTLSSLTTDRIAAEHGVSPRTAERTAAKAAAIDSATSELQAAVWRRDAAEN